MSRPVSPIEALAAEVSHLSARIARHPVITPRRSALSVPHDAMRRRWEDPLYRARVCAAMRRAARRRRIQLKPRDPMEEIK